jgi:transcriptional regulator with XRE-family HTH domain
VTNEFIQLLRVNMRLNQQQFSVLLNANRSELAQVEAGYRNASQRLVTSIRENIDAEFIELVKAVYNWRK